MINEIYKHFKGNHYLVLHLGTNTETLEANVIYVEINKKCIDTIKNIDRERNCLYPEFEGCEDGYVCDMAYSDNKIWVRPLSSWNETITLDDGEIIKRFTKVNLREEV